MVVTDDIPPEVSIQAGTPTSNSVQITVTATDEQSGLAEEGTYQYYLGNELKANNRNKHIQLYWINPRNKIYIKSSCNR